MMEVKHKLKDGKLIHEVLEKALDTGWKEATRMRGLQTDTAVILEGYGELKAKGLPDGEIIEQIARGLLPIGFDMVYWKKKVREVLKRYGIIIKKALDTQTAGEGYEWIPEGYARRPIKRIKIHQVNLNEMKELKKAKFLLRRHWWKGQCWPKNTVIMTPSGRQVVQRLKIDDLVLDADGNETRILSTNQMIFKQAAVIRIKDEKNPIVLSLNHPILIRREKNIFFCKAENCRAGDLVKIPLFKFAKCEHYGPFEKVQRNKFCSLSCAVKYRWKFGDLFSRKEEIKQLRIDAHIQASRRRRLKRQILKDNRFEAYLWGLAYGDCTIKQKRRRPREINITFCGQEETAEIFDRILAVPICTGVYTSGFGSKGIRKEFRLPIERYKFLIDAKKDFNELSSRIDGNFWSFLGGFFDAEGSIMFPKHSAPRARICIYQRNETVRNWLYDELHKRGINAKRSYFDSSGKFNAISIYEQKSIWEFAEKILPFILHQRKRRLLTKALSSTRRFNPHFAWSPILGVASKPWNKPMYSIETETGTILTRKLVVHNTVVRGMSVDHWDLVLDKGEKCLDEFAGMMNNPLDQPDGVNCIRHDCCNETPEGRSNREWMKFYGKSIPPNHPEWGNPNKRIPSYMDKVDEGSANIISDTDTFVSFVFHGKELKGYWIAKRESPKAEIWVFSKSSLPGEPRKTSQRKVTKSLSQELENNIKDFKGNILTEAERKFRLENFYKVVAATKDGTDSEPLDEVLIPYLEKINSFPFLVTTQSCCGHNRPRDEKKAHFDFRSKLTEKDTIDKLIRPLSDKFCPTIGCELMLECDRLRYILWLDNKNWKQQFEYFLNLLKQIG